MTKALSTALVKYKRKAQDIERGIISQVIVDYERNTGKSFYELSGEQQEDVIVRLCNGKGKLDDVRKVLTAIQTIQWIEIGA